MNAETQDHAAWRTFGLLPPEEQEAFDAVAETDLSLTEERARMEALAAAISVLHSRPVAPGAHVLGLIEERCGLSEGKKNFISGARLRSVLSWAGWGVAAGLAVLLAVRDHSGTLTAGQSPASANTNSPDDPQGTKIPSPRPLPSPGTPVAGTPDRGKITPTTAGTPAPVSDNKTSRVAVDPVHPSEIQPIPGSNKTEPVSEPGEKRRLIQEIETLRTELARTREQNREILSPAPGRAWPLIVEMRSPSATREDSDAPLSSQIGDALAGKPQEPKLPAAQKQTGEATPQTQLLPATAIPVYDPARDTGTLAVRNLPVVATGSQYNLWVSTADSTEPVYVGTLPDNLHSMDSLDFSLGSTGIIPTSYYLTVNSMDLATSVRTASLPNASNIVLQGP